MHPSTVSCDHCGSANLPQARFCVVCGQPMAAVPSAPPPGARPLFPAGTMVYSNPSFLGGEVAWSPDGTHIASTSWDYTVQVWMAT